MGQVRIARRVGGWAMIRLGRLPRLWWRNRGTRRRLAELPPYILKDIGIPEAEARREARRPFWQI